MIVPSKSLPEVQTTTSKLPSNIPTPMSSINRLQDEPGIRNARIKLHYKKSFQDDHLFFPETQELFMLNPYRSANQLQPNDMTGYQSSMNTNMQLNGSVKNPMSYGTKYYQPNQQHQKDNMLSLLALRNLEKQQQQQQQQQQYHHKPQFQFGSQPLHRNGQVYYPDTQQRHHGEQHHIDQSAYTYNNLRARG